MMYPFPCVPLILPIFALCSLHTGSLATKQMQADPVGTESHRCSEPWELLSLHLCAEVAQHEHHSDNVARQRCVVVSSQPATLPPIYYLAICHFQFSLERIRNKTHKFRNILAKGRVPRCAK